MLRFPVSPDWTRTDYGVVFDACPDWPCRRFGIPMRGPAEAVPAARVRLTVLLSAWPPRWRQRVIDQCLVRLVRNDFDRAFTGWPLSRVVGPPVGFIPSEDCE